MTTLRIKGLAAAAQDALEGHVRGLYDDRSRRLLFVGELEHVLRTEPGPASDTQPSVTVRIAHLEVPSQAQQDAVRELLRALFLLRTASGTLDEASGMIDLAGEARKVADGVTVAYVGEALQARSMVRELHRQMVALADDPTGDVLKIRRKLRKLNKATAAFLGAGATVESLLPELEDTPVERDTAEVDAEVRV